MYKDEAIGYGQLIKEYENLYIVNLGVIPEFRGKGYSRFILRKLITIAIYMGYKDVFLKCNEKNIAALTLYKKQEFEVVSRYKMLGFTKTNKEKEIIWLKTNDLFLYNYLLSLLYSSIPNARMSIAFEISSQFKQ